MNRNLFGGPIRMQAVFATIVLGLLVVPLHASNYIVATTTDAIDPTPGNDTCETPAGGP